MQLHVVDEACSYVLIHVDELPNVQEHLVLWGQECYHGRKANQGAHENGIPIVEDVVLKLGQWRSWIVLRLLRTLFWMVDQRWSVVLEMLWLKVDGSFLVQGCSFLVCVLGTF